MEDAIESHERCRVGNNERFRIKTVLSLYVGFMRVKLLR
jgi:hypothetical protein